MPRSSHRRRIKLTLLAFTACLIGWTQWGWRYWPRAESFAAWPQEKSDQKQSDQEQINKELRFAIVFEASPRSASNLDAAMKSPIVTLLDKTQPAPSGDNRDYVSLSIYWWPNPLTGLPWLPRDGQKNPAAGDYDAPRLQKMVNTVRTLAAAGRSDTDARALQWLRVWFCETETRMNAHLTFSQMMPGIAAGGRQGIIEGLPIATDLLDALAWMDARDAIPVADRVSIRDWLSEYLAWLLQSRAGRSECQRMNNHGTWYDVQIAAIARSLGLISLERETLLRAHTRLTTQFTLDGSQPYELSRAKSWDYSLYNLDAWRHLECIAQRHQETFWPDGPAQALRYLQTQASTWPSDKVTRSPVESLRRFEARLARQLVKSQGTPVVNMKGNDSP
jgi:hypothetical protein